MRSIDALQSYAVLGALFICVVVAFILLLKDKGESKFSKILEKKAIIIIWALAIFSLLGRVAITTIYYGIEEIIPDALLFRIWAQTLFEQGLPAVYSPEVHAESGPMLMYFFYVFEAISQMLNAHGGSLLHTILIKMPAYNLAECVNWAINLLFF